MSRFGEILSNSNWPKGNKLDAAVAPTATDDSSAGYEVGSTWVDTTADKAYICIDATAAAAIWVETTQSSSGSNLPEASGLIDGAVLSVNGGDNTKFDLSAGTGQIVDAKTTPSSPTITPVTIAGATAITVTNLATQFYTYILVDSAGSIIQQTTPPTSEQLRTDIFIGKLNHANKTNLASVVNTPSLAIGTSSGLEDLMQEAIGVINATPMVVSSGGANLNIDISGGDLFQIGVGYDTDKNKPHIKTFAGFDSSVTPFVYVTSNTIISAPTNVLLPASFESPLGTIASVASNKWTNQRVYKTLTGNVLVMYGQAEYNSKALALEGLYNEVHSTPGILTSGEAILIGIITLVDTATDSTNTNQVVFQQASKFGEYAKGSAGISTGTLQAAYDNSTEPEILIASGEALSLQSATDGAEIVQDWKDELGNVTASITGDGTLSSGGTTNSTGVLSGGELSVGAGGPGVATTYDISDGVGQIVTSTGVRTKVSWTGLTGETPIFGPSVITFVAINSGGTVTQQSTPFSRVQSRTLIPLGVIVHVNGVNVDTINNEQEIAYNPMSSLYDAMESIGFFNVSGNIFAPNGANLNIDKSVGDIFKLGSNYDTAPADNPHVRNLPSKILSQFQYRFSDGSSGILTETNIDPNNLDDGAGGLTAVAANRWSIQRIYVFTSNNVKIQRGVAEYPSLEAAVAGISTEAYITEPSIAANGLLRGWLIVKQGATALNGADAQFLSAPKFGEGNAGATGAIVDLQTAYDNSLANPELLTDATNGAFTVRRGSAADTDNIYEGQNNAGTINFAVTGEGKINALDFNGVPLTTVGSALNFLNEQGNYVTAPGGGSLTSVTNAGMLAIVSPSVGDQVFNTTWGQVYTFDGDVWINPNLIKCVNGSAAVMAEGYVVIQDATVSNEVTTTTTAGSIAVVAVVKDIYGGGGVGQFVTVAVSGEHNVLMAGAVSIGEAILSDNVAGQATATGTGATGVFGVARESKGAPGTALIKCFIQPTERF